MKKSLITLLKLIGIIWTNFSEENNIYSSILNWKVHANIPAVNRVIIHFFHFPKRSFILLLSKTPMMWNWHKFIKQTSIRNSRVGLRNLAVNTRTTLSRSPCLQTDLRRGFASNCRIQMYNSEKLIKWYIRGEGLVLLWTK